MINHSDEGNKINHIASAYVEYDPDSMINYIVFACVIIHTKYD